MAKKNGATAEVPPQLPPGKQGKAELFLLPKDHARRASSAPISQLRLARIQQMQAEIAYLQKLLTEEWDGIRKALLLGAEVEKGPLRAWIKCTLRLGHAKTIGAPRKVAKTLMVR